MNRREIGTANASDPDLKTRRSRQRDSATLGIPKRHVAMKGSKGIQEQISFPWKRTESGIE
jgi:hypothetical protein